MTNQKEQDVEDLKAIIETINAGETEENIGFNTAVLSLHKMLFPTFRQVARNYGYEGWDAKTMADTALFASIFDISLKYDPEKGKGIESFAWSFARNTISKIKRDDTLIHIPHVLKEDLKKISRFMKENPILEEEELIEAVINMLPASSRSRKYAEKLIAMDPDLIPSAVIGEEYDERDKSDNCNNSSNDSFSEKWNPEVRTDNHELADNTMNSLWTILRDEEQVFIYCTKIGVSVTNDEYEYGLSPDQQPSYEDVTAQFREKFPNSKNGSRNWIKKQYLHSKEKVLACLNHDFSVNMDNLIAFEERERQEQEQARELLKERRKARGKERAKLKEKQPVQAAASL